MASSRLVNRNIVSQRGRTSIRLEPELWDAVKEICSQQGITVADLVRAAESAVPGAGRTSAVRVYTLGYFRAAAADAAQRAGAVADAGAAVASV